jgi:hypothetical protein
MFAHLNRMILRMRCPQRPHHPEGLKLSFLPVRSTQTGRADNRVGLILQLQHHPAPFAVQPLQSKFVVYDRDDNVAGIRGGSFFKIESDPFYFSNRRRNIEGASMTNRVCLARAKSA